MTRRTVRRTPAPKGALSRLAQALISGIIMGAALFAGALPAQAQPVSQAIGLAASAKTAATTGVSRVACGRYAFCDTFIRGNTAVGSLGTPLNGPAYDMRGNGGSIAATTGQVSSNTFTSDASATAVYAVQTSATPVSEIGGIFGWTAAGGGGSQASVTMLISVNPGGASFINLLPLHAVITQTQLQIGYFTSSTFTIIKSLTFPTALATGTDYSADFVIDGNLIRYSVAGYTGVVYQPQLAQQGSTLKYPAWELFYGSTTPPALPYYKATWYGTAPNGTAQLADLATSYWKLDTSAWTDATGQAQTLTGTNSPVTGTGIIGNGVSLTRASSMKLTAASSAPLQLGNRDWTISLWFKAASTPTGSTYYPLVSKAGSSATVEYYVLVDGVTGRFECAASTDGTFGNAATALNTTTITSGVWHHGMCVYDSLNKTLSAYLDGQLSASGAVSLASVFSSTSTFEVGFSTALNNIHAGSYWDGLIDEVAIFSSPPGQGGAVRDPSRFRLYNDGEGFSYPF